MRQRLCNSFNNLTCQETLHIAGQPRPAALRAAPLDAPLRPLFRFQTETRPKFAGGRAEPPIGPVAHPGGRPGASTHRGTGSLRLLAIG